MTPTQIADDLRSRFSVNTPLFLAHDTTQLKLELKPYLQPFERLLAIRELRALLNAADVITEEHGYTIVSTDIPEEVFRQRLTYWQRLGRAYLQPSIQKSLEFTQNGLLSTTDKRELHNARRLRYGPHDLHEYRGKFFPQLVRSLINISGVHENALILDPMVGSGTTTCEALATGHSAIGADLNPLSVLIATVKSNVVLERPTRFWDYASKCLSEFHFKRVSPEDVWSEDDCRYLRLWFDADALRDVAAIVSDLKKLKGPLYRQFFRICLSNVLRSVSWQKDTDLRVRKEVKPYESGTATKRFKQEAEAQIDRIYPYLCVLPKFTPPPSLCIRHGNAVSIAAMFPEHRGSVDLLITSPPYATALPYLDTDRLSLIALGLLPRKQHRDAEVMMVGTREVTERQRQETWDGYLKRRGELPARVTRLIEDIAAHNHGDSVGFRRRNLPALLGKYYLDMLDAMRSARAMMAPGAQGYYVVGNNSSTVDGEKMDIPTDDFLFDIGEAAGWSKQETIPMELLTSRDIFRENRGSTETILSFEA